MTKTVWTQIRLLLQEQSNLGLHGLNKRLKKSIHQTTKADDVIGALRVIRSIEVWSTDMVDIYGGPHRQLISLTFYSISYF